MAGYLSNYAENKLLDHMLKVAAFNRPANLFLASCTADPGETGTGGTIVEPSAANAYARQPCDDWTVAASRASANSVAITFPAATGTWGIQTHFAILDTVTLATGNIIAYGLITPNKTIATSDQLEVAIGDLDVSWNAGGLSDFAANGLLDHLFYNTAFGQPTSIFIALCTATILDADTGSTISEPGENYARINHDTWKIAAAGASSNSGAVVFAKATGSNWGTITDFALCNTLTTGNILFHAGCTIDKLVEVADIARFADGELDVTAD